MPTITVRNLPDEVHRALKVRAATHGRSTEAEVRAILETAINPQGRLRLGDALADISRKFKLRDKDLEFVRNAKPAEPMSFE